MNFFVGISDDYTLTVGNLRAVVNDAPSIDIEPKRGEWKNHKDEHYCTNCGEVVIGDWYDEDDWYTYCPNCGARMKGADDDGRRTDKEIEQA